MKNRVINWRWPNLQVLVLFALVLVASPAVMAADDYDLWLGYAAADESAQQQLAENMPVILVPQDVSPTIELALAELEKGLGQMLGRPVPVERGPVLNIETGGALVIDAGAAIPGVEPEAPDSVHPDAWSVRTSRNSGVAATVITGNSDVAKLYGAFGLLRYLATGGDPANIDIESAPAIDRRLLNHWDNLDRSVERGYAGLSLWDWMTLPEHKDQRYIDYARANASIGINGSVLNNVNSRADSLTPEYIEKAAALADIFRPYGIRVYLSARFSAPIDIGGLENSDPLNPAVQRWWRDKAAEIYAAIPDFGGFLVKANSEGQPGPQDYGRTHADGANMLADAVGGFGGIVMWRAFVYSDTNPEDRAKQAYSEFMPLDGEFADNVIIQVKNGPIDFQPREPFHPLFGAMVETPLMMEFQVTKEYLGMASHLVYLAPMYEEVFDADTRVTGRGSTVARVSDGSLYEHELTAIAGVANTGTDHDWTGSTFNQANWYAYGRLAWEPELDSEVIAAEWLRQTFSNDDEFVAQAIELMMLSREAPVNYMTPLGLTHLMATGHHYGPGPWVSNLGRPEWNPVYYHQADADGIGFDRTATGSNALEQYAAPVAGGFGDLDRVGDEFLLWFHHLPWDYEMDSGRTLWEELVARYDLGVAQVAEMQQRWSALEPYLEPARFRKTAELLAVQHREAKWWRDASVAYFQSVSGLPLPAGAEPPPESLDYYISIDNQYAPG